MPLKEIIDALFPIAFLLAAIALIWFIVELVMTVRKARKVVVDIKNRIEPTLESVEKITASLEPVAAKADPLMERVSLTVDAANLELMRVDQILEDVSEVTDAVSSAAGAIDAAANAPIELVSKVSSRVRDAFKPRGASSESIDLGAEKATDTVSRRPQNPELVHPQDDMSGVRQGYRSATAAGQSHAEPTAGVVAQDGGEPEQAVEDSRYYTYTNDAAPSGGAVEQGSPSVSEAKAPQDEKTSAH